MQVINLAEKFTRFSAHWHPHIVGELNGQQVKIAKVKGEFIWHQHDAEDEMFIVIKGKLFIDFKEKTVEINEGEMIIVPRGVPHRPHSEEEVHIMLFEPASTINTGETENELTRKNLSKI